MIYSLQVWKKMFGKVKFSKQFHCWINEDRLERLRAFSEKN